MSKEYVKTEYGVVPIPDGFDEVEYLSNSLFKVRKEGKYGICNSIGKIIVEIENEIIELFESSFIVTYNGRNLIVHNLRGEAILGPVEIGSICAINYYLFLYIGDDTSLYNYKGELLWRMNHTIRQAEKVEGLDDSSFLICRDKDWNEGILDLNGKIIIPTKYKNITYDRGFFITECVYYNTDKNAFGLYDIMGNQILEDKYGKIYIQENRIIAVDHEYSTNRFWYLLDSYGQLIYTASDIAPTGNGMYVVSTWNQKQRKYLDGVIDLCGNEILPCSYHRIEAYKDGIFYISRNTYGRNSGQLEAKEINCEGVRKLSLSGNIEVANGEENILLPSDYNWATDFVNGLAIVRSNSGVGVIDTNLNVVVNACYHSISFLDNKTILLNSLAEGNQYRGIMDWFGNVIIPTQFTKIKQISEDRYIANRENEWCIYDNKGNMLSEEYYVDVRDFKYSFEDFDIICAVVYKAKQKINNNRVRFLLGGVIDEDGNELIPCIYDKVTLYPPHYALCVRNKIFTIADFGENKQTSFPKMNIRHVYYIDKLGRCLFSDDCEYNNKDGRWEGGTKGVLSLNGIVVAPHKYDSIKLLENGLMQVCINRNWGLLNSTGKELLPVKYTKISDFRDGFATICLGGEYDDSELFSSRIKNGKWGVINEKGELVVECIHNSESFHDLINPLKERNKTESVYVKHLPHPQNILSLSFSELPKVNSNIEYMHGYWGDDEDGSGYTSDEIDQMYRDAFDNNPELEWNID